MYVYSIKYVVGATIFVMYGSEFSKRLGSKIDIGHMHQFSPPPPPPSTNNNYSTFTFQIMRINKCSLRVYVIDSIVCGINFLITGVRFN